MERAGFRMLATAIPRAFSGLRQRGFRAGGPRPDFSLAREARTLPVLPDHEGGVHGALSASLLADRGQVPALYLEKGWGRSERGASCESRNDLVGLVSAAEAGELAQRPAGVGIFGTKIVRATRRRRSSPPTCGRAAVPPPSGLCWTTAAIRPGRRGHSRNA